MKILFVVCTLFFYSVGIVEQALGQDAVKTYAESGFFKRQAGNYDGAIADLTKAIEEMPDDTFAYFQRAAAKEDKGDLDGAIADYTSLIAIRNKLKWDVSGCYEERGAVKQVKGDFKGAVDDYNLMLAEPSSKVIPYYLRGVAKYMDGDLQGALLDFQTCTKQPREQQMVNDSGGDIRPYIYIDIWVILNKLDKKEAAAQQLASYLHVGEQEDRERDPEYRRWHPTVDGVPVEPHTDFDEVAEFLLNEKSDPDFFKVDKSSPSWRYSHYYYAGMKALFLNDKNAAAGYFSKYLAAIKLDPAMYDYLIVMIPFSVHRQLSEAELKRLEK